MKNNYWILFFIFFLENSVISQNKDSIATKTLNLNDIIITEYRTVNGVGYLSDVKDAIIYAGKKTEVIITDSLDANKAINNTRQILGRTPGFYNV